ncbi:hypothetical protein ES708_02401 [subsurface metagenome]
MQSRPGSFGRPDRLPGGVFKAFREVGDKPFLCPLIALPGL